MASTKKSIFTVFAAILVFCLVALALAFVPGKPASADNSFIKTDELKIAHITDTHYYPLNYCYSGDEAVKTDFDDSLISGTKLFVESSVIIKQALTEVLAQKPDYLFVTGDLTLNGEIQGHVEIANLLRDMQNKMRAAGNPDFQVFVTMGNHDMYNLGGVHYRNGGQKKVTSHLTTRRDITKLYSSLGYPDLSDSEIEAYYATLSDVYYDNLPYEGNYINSQTADNVQIDYQYIDQGQEDEPDYDNGAITYIAYLKDNYTLISMDEEISDINVNHQAGGVMYENIRQYIDSKAEIGAFQGQNLLGIAHHNFVPHFPLQDSLLKDFTIYGWREVSDYFADLGMRYVFSGHMHANDIAKHQSLNNNIIIDTQTAAATGFKGGTRYAVLQKGSVGGEYAENYITTMDAVDDVDISMLYTQGYINDAYIEFCKLEDYIAVRGDKHIIIEVSEYAATKLFRNIVNNLKYSYLKPDFIANISGMLGDMLASSDNYLVGTIIDLVVPMIDNLIIHLEDVVLADYTYRGTNADYFGSGRGKKLCGYLEELIDKALTLSVNERGDKLFDFGIGAYLAHQGGIDTSLQDADPGIIEALQGFEDGTHIKTFLDILLDKNTGLLRLVEGLFLPLDLTKNITPEQASGFEALFSLLAPEDKTIVGSALVLDDIVPKVLEILQAIMDIDFDLGVLTLGEYLNKLLEDYITDSFYTGLGEIGYNILCQFYIDETSATENGFDGYVEYRYDNTLPCTYVSDMSIDAPSIDNGKLPSMLAVTFGQDPATTKNFVWFTDRRISGTDIQYKEVGTDTQMQISGTFEVYATTTASIDLGIFATLMQVPIGRHTVELTDLKPATTYSYRVGSESDSYWSEYFSFKTAPASETTPFELLLITDIQGSALRTYEQAAEVMAKVGDVFPNGYDFVINCGDVVDNSRNLVQWRYMLDTLQGYWGNTTQVVAAGNHDEYTYEPVEEDEVAYNLVGIDALDNPYSYFLWHYNLSYPDQNDLTGTYYSFDYSGVHFTVLNTNDLSKDKKLSNAQLAWLKADLEGTQKAKVVLMHKGIYSSGSHSTEADIVALRAQLTPLFAEYGVHLVLAGHDHTYSESYYLDANGDIVETSAQGKQKLGTEGTLYITLGTFGDKYYKYVDNPDVPLEFGKDLHTPTLTNPTFGKLIFDGTDLYYYGYEYDLETSEILPVRRDDGFIKTAVGIIALFVFVTVTAIAIGASVAIAKKTSDQTKTNDI